MCPTQGGADCPIMVEPPLAEIDHLWKARCCNEQDIVCVWQKHKEASADCPIIRVEPPLAETDHLWKARCCNEQDIVCVQHKEVQTVP